MKKQKLSTRGRSKPTERAAGRRVRGHRPSEKRSERQNETDALLRESEERYNLLFNNSLVGILLTTPDGGILTANSAACRMFGRTEEEICRLGRNGIVDVRDPRLPSYLKERERTGKAQGELTLLRADGTRFIGAVSSTVFKGKYGRLRTSMVVRDITERKEMENEIAAWAKFSYENPNPMLRLAPGGIAVIANKAGTGLLKEWGGKIGRKLPDFLAGPAAASFKSGKRKTIDVECAGRFYSFAIVPVSKGGYINFYGRDITEHKKAEGALRKAHGELEVRVQERTAELKKTLEALKTERQRFNDVLDMLPAYVVLLTPDYHVPFANRFFEERFGKAKGRRCYEYLFGRSKPCQTCETYKVLKTHLPHHWEWTGPDGRSYDIHDFPFTDVDGLPLVMEMGIDITDRKQAEEALKDLNLKLEQRVAERTAELRQTRDYLESLFNYANAPIICWDTKLKITRFNHAFENLTGYRAGEVIGRNLSILFPKETKEESLVKIKRSLTEHWEVVEIPILRKDGDTRLALWNSANVYAEDGKSIQATIAQGQDITERKKKEEELRRLNRTLTALSDSSQAMLKAADESDYLNQVCRIVVEDCGHAMVWIGFADEDEAKTIRPAAHAGFEEGYLETLKLTWADTERGRGPIGTAIRTGRPSQCCDMLTDPNFKPWRGEAIKRGYASLIVLPLTAGEKVFGVVNIYSKEKDPFSKDEEKLLTELASDLSFGITAIRLRSAHLRSEEALRETNEYLQNLLNHANAPIIVWDPDFRITQFNHAFERLTGYAADSVIGKKLDLLFPTDSRDASMTKIGQTLKGERWESVEIPILHRDGNVRVVLWNSANVYAPDGLIPLATIAQGQDITERKQVEEALKESEERYKLAQKAAGIGTWDWDMRSGLLKWSEEVAKLFGISLDRFNGTIQAFMDLVHPDDRSQLQSAIDACVEEGNDYHASHRIVLPDGSVRWMWEMGNVIRNQKNLAVRMLGVVVDITDVRRANEERARLAEIVGASWDAVIGSTPDGTVTSWNPGAERMFGFSEKEMIGRPFSLIVPQDQVQEFSELLERMKKGKRIGYLETVRTTKSGKRIDVSLSLSPIMDASCKVIALSSIERDISHRKRMEEALKKSRNELEQRVKERTAELEKVNQILQAEISEREQTQRQLRSLTAILAKTEERERRRIATDLHDRIIQTLVYANMKLGELRESAAGTGVPKIADEVGQFVQQTIHDLRTLTFELSPPVLYELGFVPAVKWLIRQFEEKHDLVVEFQENDVPEAIHEDVRIVLFQALRELLTNAVKHAKAKCVRVALYRDENALKTVVEDDGVGFDSSRIHLNAKDNTGFGIFNIRERLESVKGGMSIESHLGAGTRIEMTAPLES